MSSFDSPTDDEFFDALSERSSRRSSSPKKSMSPVKESQLPPPEIAFLPATPVLGSPTKSRKLDDPSSTSRRRKLDSLRHRMLEEHGGETSDHSSIASESTSLSSWGHHFLISNDPSAIINKDENITVSHVNTVHAADTQSTKGQSPAKQSSPDDFVPLLPPPPKSGVSPFSLSTGPPPDTKSSSSFSTSSSRSNTMEKYETPQGDMPGTSSKSNSLDRGMSLRLRTCYAGAPVSKTNSLSREFSTSMADSSFMSFEEEQEEKRKDSHAVQVIDELTSELAIEVERRDEPCINRSMENKKLSTVEEQTSPEPCSASDDSPERYLPTLVENGHKQPDIVASHSRKLGHHHPVAPPRRRKRSLTSSPPEHLPSTSIVVKEATPEPSPVTAQPDSDSLRKVTVTNLDTGEQLTLDKAAENICSIDPISYHILKRKLSMHKHLYPDTLSIPDTTFSETSSVSSFDPDSQSLASNSTTREYLKSARSRAMLFKRAVGKGVGKVMSKTVSKVRYAAGEVTQKFHGQESPFPSDDEEENPESAGIVRSKHHKKGPFDFDQLRKVQDLSGEHSGAVWCLKFSLCGRLLATAGQDNVIRVWVLRDHYEYFNMMREKYNLEAKKSTAVGNVTDLVTQITADGAQIQKSLEGVESSFLSSLDVSAEDIWAPFVPKPFCAYRGHTADVLDLSWSKNYFVLSSSMDRTVRLWHISRNECLCCFQHIDFVTCIAFLPKDDRYFLSGSLDAKLRLWHIPDKKVAIWNEVEGGRLVTALTFVKNGKFAVVGTFDGRCIFYSTEQLKYHTVIDVRSSRGKNSRGHKVTGLAVHGDKLLVTSNDSRVRLYDLRDLSLTCKYKGASNYASQIRASFSPHGKHIICGSEDKFVYLWRTSLESATLSVRKDRNTMWERVRGHNTVVTSGIFAPKPELVFQQIERAKRRHGADSAPGTPNSSDRRKEGRMMTGDILVTADFSGAISVFMNRLRIKTGASVFFPTD